MTKPGSATILVVDDEAPIRLMLQQVLTQEGYDIVTAEDGKEGLDLILKSTPDLILLDLRMPRLDGITFLKAMRTDPKTRSIPVIVLTGLKSRETLEQAMEAGADDFVTKPFETVELKIRIRAMLKLKNISDELERLQEYILSMRKERGHAGD